MKNQIIAPKEQRPRWAGEQGPWLFKDNKKIENINPLGRIPQYLAGVGKVPAMEPKTMIMPNPSIKDEEKYRALREKGYSKEKSARIANTPDSGKKGGKAKAYGQWTKQQLYEKAREVGISGRSKMDKGALIHALRNH